MVESKLLRLLVAAVSASLLGACGLFTASNFPAVATQIAAQRDLSAEIPADFAQMFTLSTVTAGGTDLVFLTTQMPYDGPHLIVMDQDLNVLQSFTLQDLITTYGAPMSNTGAFLGALGDVVILGLHSTPTSSGLTGLAKTTLPLFGAFSMTDGTNNFANFSASGNQLTYTVYTSGWSTSTNLSTVISSNASFQFNFVSIYGDPAGPDAALILEETATGQDYFILIPKSALNGLAPPDILSNYPYFTASRADNRLVAYSQKGFISFQRASNGPGGTFIRFDTSGNTLPYSLRYTDTTNIEIATRNAGGWYYSYNRDARTVTKLNAWWGQ